MPLVAVVGATGTGKSRLSLDLADDLAALGIRAEIVNADAMQFYRGMEIGTAKLPLTERRGIRHHLFDMLAVTDDASVADYQRIARDTINDIRQRGAVPILVGGSGLYVSSVIYNFEFPGTDPVIRARLEAELIEVGPGTLYQRLKSLDDLAAIAIGPHNGRRLVRALEVIELTGRSIGGGLPDESNFWRPTTILGLRSERATLIARLDDRVEQMWRDGLPDEVRSLLPLGLERGITASRAIGYSQAIEYLHGTLDQTEAIELTQALTRRYARRQVGWFRRYPGVTWLEYAADDGAEPDFVRQGALAAVFTATSTAAAG
ncbi:MAG: tRNA (adenosine(37)-N6)-dimethylallyltransferase MiaA [Microbacteriaceae bacterium]|nr:tRNA (adenosine(37)-N6)-dimethylallyltransferase MiaA [Microbacteriaceae bacterium]